MSHLKTALLVATALMMPIAANASTFQYDSYSVTNEQNITISSPIQGFGGIGMITLNGAGANLGQNLIAWCIDLFANFQGSSLYNISPLTTAGVGTPGNGPLTTSQLNQMGSLMLHGEATVPSSPTFDLSAAFQLGIWSVEYGQIASDASPALASLAAQLVAMVQPGGAWDCPTCSVTQLGNGGGSQSLGFGSNVPVSQAPIPGAVWLFATGMAGLGWLTRRRRQKKELVQC